ncbi:MAG: AAA family ATPase, partial [Gammaproteobacteria bacterium]
MPRRKLVVPTIILELGRRRVFRAAAAYLIGSWVLVEISSVVLDAFSAPAWILRAEVIALVALFPVMLVIAWRFDVTRSGLVRSISDLHGAGAQDDGSAEAGVVLPEGISGSERRTVSVLVCRLDAGHVDEPAAIARELDSERQSIARIVATYGGHLADAASDEVLVYFGYPVAHEDDARRALRAGLGILSRQDVVTDDDRDSERLAVAVHTGLVVVRAGDAEGDAITVVGPTVDNTRHLHDMADPGSLLVSDTTWHRVEGYFEGQVHAASHPIEGIEGVHRVLARTGVRNRLDLSAWQDLTPLAGRDRELSSLEDSWRNAQQGAGQVVLLSGEAGIGKSRLIEGIKQVVSTTEGAIIMTGYCSALRTSSSLFPFTSLLLQTIPELEADLPSRQRLEALRGFLDEQSLYDEEDFFLLANLLGLEIGETSIVERMSPPMRLQRTVAALLSLLLAQAGDRPLLLVVEDLHWADPTSLALLGLLVDHTATSSLLVVLSFRPEFSAPWIGRSHVHPLQLGRLQLTDARNLLQGIPGAETLPDAVLEAVVQKTDGVPLFVEEVVKIVLEQAARTGQEIGPEAVDVIPDTLQDSLLARLDQLGEAKGVAQLGAMLGREFSYRLLEALAGLEEEKLQELLAELLGTELLFQKGVPPRSLYLFKHALIQDAAYHSLLRKDRQENHLRIGRLLEKKFPDIAQSQPGTTARHFAEGGDPAKAGGYYLAAGSSALKKSAAQEAADYVSQGLEQMEKLPPCEDRDRLELGLRMIQGPAFMATVGFADTRTREIYERAQHLSGALEDASALVPILFGLWIHHGARGELARNRELAHQLLDIATQAQDADLLLEGNLVVGCSSFHMGELAVCRRHFEQILADYRAEDHGQHAYVFGQDPMAAGGAYLSSVLWCLGEPGRAFEIGQMAIARAREMEHPYTLALALIFVARVYQMNKDPETVARLAGEVLQVAADFGFPTWQGFGLILKGCADAQMGQMEQGLAMIEQGLSLCSTIQLGVSRAYFLTMAAEVRNRAGDADGAIAWL